MNTKDNVGARKGTRARESDGDPPSVSRIKLPAAGLPGALHIGSTNGNGKPGNELIEELRKKKNGHAPLEADIQDAAVAQLSEQVARLRKRLDCLDRLGSVESALNVSSAAQLTELAAKLQILPDSVNLLLQAEAALESVTQLTMLAKDLEMAMYATDSARKERDHHKRILDDIRHAVNNDGEQRTLLGGLSREIIKKIKKLLSSQY